MLTCIFATNYIGWPLPVAQQHKQGTMVLRGLEQWC